MGQAQLPAEKATWEFYFGSSSEIRGLAFGTSGDSSTELLWHLQNGLSCSESSVKVLMIGTNDLGNPRHLCSKRQTLAGVLHVAEYLSRPGVPLVLHGILPRSDSDGSFALGDRWREIQWINHELKKFCDLRDDWYYMEAIDIFLWDTPSGSREVDPNQMDDALHPTASGYDRWGTLIYSKLQEVLGKKGYQQRS